MANTNPVDQSAQRAQEGTIQAQNQAPLPVDFLHQELDKREKTAIKQKEKYPPTASKDYRFNQTKMQNCPEKQTHGNYPQRGMEH